eukprot:EG_transcript_3248
MAAAWNDQGTIPTLAVNVLGAGLALAAFARLHRGARFRPLFHHRCVEDGEVGDVCKPQRLQHLLRPAPPKRWISQYGGDYAILLSLQSDLAQALGWYCLVALVLIPINATDDYRQELSSPTHPFTPGIEDWTMFNVRPASWRFLASIVASVVMSVLMWRVVLRGLGLLDRFKTALVDPVQWSTAMVHRSPCHSTQEFQSRFLPPGIAPPTISIPRTHLPRFGELLQERQAMADRLRHVYIHRLRQRSPLLARRRWWVPWERKVDAAQLLEGRIRAVDAQVAAVVDQYYRQPLAGPAFLTFASVQDHLTFRRWQAQHRPPFGEVTVAPHPSDLLWANLHHSACFRRLTSLLCRFLFCLLLLFWTLPVTLLSSLDQIAELPAIGKPLHFVLTLNWQLAGLLQAFLPVVVLAAFNSLLPDICHLLQNLSAPHSHTTLERSVFRGYFIFAFSVLILTAVFGAGLQGLAGSPHSLSWDSLAHSLYITQALTVVVRASSPKVGFFLAKSIYAAFPEMWIPCLQLWPLLTGLVWERGALSDRERREAYQPEVPPLWLLYAEPLLVLSISVVFGVTLPCIPLVGAFYFHIKLRRDHYLFRHVYPKRPAVHLTLFPLVLHFVLIILDIHHFSMLTLLASKSGWRACAFYSIVPAVTALLHVGVAMSRAVVLPCLEKVAADTASDARSGVVASVLQHWRRPSLSEATPLLEGDVEKLCGGPPSSPLGSDAYLHPIEAYRGPSPTLEAILLAAQTEVEAETTDNAHDGPSPIPRP